MKKLKLLVVITFAVIVAFLLYFLIINSLVDSYIEDYTDIGRSIALFDFYDNYEDIEKDIFYIGPSSFKEDIDAGLIGEINGYNNFNLGNPASTPIRRYVEINHIIKTNPEIIVLGVGPMSLSGKWLSPDDHYALISDKTKINNNLRFYDEYPINLNKLQLLLYKRKFLGSAIFKKIESISGSPLYYGDYNIDFKSENILKQVKGDFDPKFAEEMGFKDNFEEFEAPLTKNNEKIAFELIVKRLKENNVQVFIVKIPVNPLLSERIPKEYLDNYNNFILMISEEYNIKVLDYAETYGENYFYDGLHLNKFGRENFSKKLAKDVA